MSVILFLLFGTIAGTTGVIPFLHTNLLLQLLSLSSMNSIAPLGIALFAVALAFSHAIFEIIPAVFFAVPSTSQTISVLPAQKMAREGKGIAAAKIMLYSFAGGAILAILAAPAAALILPATYEAIKPVTAIILLAVIAVTIFSEKQNRLIALGIFGLSGGLGLALLQTGSGDQTLFPMLTGLFALPALLIVLRTEALPRQAGASVKTNWKLVVLGTLLGVSSGLLPAMSPAIVAGIVFIFLESKPEAFLTLASAIAGSKLLGDLLILGILGKARSGMAVAANNALPFPSGIETAMLVVGALVAIAAAAAIFLVIYPKLIAFFSEKNYSTANKLFLCALIAGLFALSGPKGLFISAIATCIGLLPVLLKMRRSLCCGALILPALAYLA